MAFEEATQICWTYDSLLFYALMSHRAKRRRRLERIQRMPSDKRTYVLRSPSEVVAFLARVSKA